MLETIRQYANDKLVEAGESKRLRDKHLKHFLDLALTAEPHLMRSEQLEWLPVLDADYDNLRNAFEWSLSNEMLEASLSFSKALGWFWIFRCYWLEGLSFAKRALTKSPQMETVSEEIACVGALYTCAQLQWQLGNFEQILPLAQICLSLALKVSDKRDVAISKFYLGIGLMRHGGDYAQAISLLKESFTELQAINEVFWLAYTFPYHGEFLIGDDELKHREKVVRSLELARASGDRLTLANALSLYADLLLRSGSFPESRKNAEESIMLYERLGLNVPSINSFVLAEIAWVNGNTAKAQSIYASMRDRYSLLGEKAWRSFCATGLGLLAMDNGDLKGARIYLDEALELSRQIGSMAFIAQHLIELGHLFFCKAMWKSSSDILMKVTL
jgi:tetratricopeptide (TPR) repeat protein